MPTVSLPCAGQAGRTGASLPPRAPARAGLARGCGAWTRLRAWWTLSPSGRLELAARSWPTGVGGDKEAAGCGLRDAAGLPAALDGTSALPGEQRGNGWGIRLDTCTVPQPFALEEPSRGLGHVGLGAQGLAQRRGTRQTRLGGLGQSDHRWPESKQACFCLAHQAPAPLAVATTLASTAAPDLPEGFGEMWGMAL